MPPADTEPGGSPTAGLLAVGSGEEPAAADVASAVVLAGQLGEPVEAVDRTTEIERHLANPDGTVTYESYAVPQRVRQPQGWVPVDTDLVVAGGRVKPGATLLDMSLSAGGSDELLVIADGGRRLALSWPQPLPAPVLSDDTATYPDVLPGVDLVVRVEPESFAMALMVRTRAAAAQPALSRVAWRVSTDGVSLRVTDEGAVEATDDTSGDVVFAAPPSLMWDSPQPPEPAVAELETRLGEPAAAQDAQERGPGWVARMPVELSATELAVMPDVAMLTDPATTFPVSIDPSFSRAVTNWAPVFAARPNDSWPSGTSSPRDFLRVGPLNWAGCGSWCGLWRSHLRFSISEMAGEQLVGNPTFRIRLEHSASCNATPVALWRTNTISSGNVTWNSMSDKWLTNFGTRSANANKGGGCSDSPQPDVNMEWSSSTIRDRLQSAMDSGNTTFTFGMRASNESDAYQWKRFNAGSARLIATYNSPPLTPDRLAIDADCYTQCSSPAVVRTLRPWLEARVRDPHSAPLQAEFEVRNSANSIVASGTVNNVNSGGTARWRPPSNLAQEQTLRFRVRARNQHLTGSWSGYFTFTADTNPPNTPTVSSPLYLHKDTATWNGGVGQTGSFTFGPNGSNDVIRFGYRWLGGSETTINVSKGASHTFNLAPPGDLEQVLQVRSIDHAGNISGWRSYAFYVRPQPTDVAYWKFDEGQGTIAAPATGNPTYTGILRNGVTWVASGINADDPTASGTALSFNGEAYVEMPRVLATDHPAGWSVTAWVYATDLSSWRTVLGQDGMVNNMFNLQYRPTANGGAGGWCLNVRDQDSANANETILCAPADQLHLERWTHLAAVYDRPAGKVRLYVDGGPDNGEAPPGWSGEATAPPAWASTGSFQVGRARGNTGESRNFWYGHIDEVRAHQRVLTEFEIQHTFLQCRYANCPQVPDITDPVLVAQWDLDEGSGPIAADSSGLENHATVQAGATWTSNGYNGTPAASFDGQSGHLRTDGPVLLTDQSYTVSAWAQISELGDWHTVVAQEGASMSPFRLMYRHAQDGWCFTIRLTDTVGGTLRHACGPKPQVGVWTHLVGVYEAPAGQARLYVNGSLVATQTVETSWQANGPFLIGRTLDQGGVGTGDHFPGQIDQVRAYQTALTNAQVSSLFAGVDP